MRIQKSLFSYGVDEDEDVRMGWLGRTERRWGILKPILKASNVTLSRDDGSQLRIGGRKRRPMERGDLYLPVASRNLGLEADA